MKPAIGTSDFKDLVSQNKSTGEKALYIDKTLLIRDIVFDFSKYILFTRPRRFGKTLNMSMLKYFFHEKIDIFDNLNIARYPNIIQEHQGKRPTIFLTFKGVKGQGDFESLKVKYLRAIYEALEPFKDFIGNDFESIFEDYSHKPPFVTHASSIKYTCEKIAKKLGVKPLIICDEYDTPSNDAYNTPYLQRVLSMMKELFESTFKDNNYVYKGIITGINRIAKENLFSGLNGLNICSISNPKYPNYFGFTQEDISALDLSNDTVISKYVSQNTVVPKLHRLQSLPEYFEQPISLPGNHNSMNIAIARCAANILGITDKAIEASLATFGGVPHRIQHILDIKEVSFYNDSKATNVDSARVALESFKKPIVWIAGGYDKGNDYSKIRSLVLKKVKAIVCITHDYEKFVKEFASKLPICSTQSMQDAVVKAYKFSKPGDVVLLSPACASFDLFKDYEHRGKEFVKATKYLARICP